MFTPLNPNPTIRNEHKQMLLKAWNKFYASYVNADSPSYPSLMSDRISQHRYVLHCKQDRL